MVVIGVIFSLRKGDGDLGYFLFFNLWIVMLFYLYCYGIDLCIVGKMLEC